MNSFPIAHAGSASKRLYGFLAIIRAKREPTLGSFSRLGQKKKQQHQRHQLFLLPLGFMALFSATCSVNLGKAVVAGFYAACVRVSEYL